LSLTILRQLEEEGTRRTSKEVLLKAPVGIINYLMNEKREHISIIESRYGLAIRLEADTHLISPDFSIEKFKTATRNILTDQKNVVSMGSIDLSDLDSEIKPEIIGASNEVSSSDQHKKRRRRRRKVSKQREIVVQADADEVKGSSSENNENTTVTDIVDKGGLKSIESVTPSEENNNSSSGSANDTEVKVKKKSTRKTPEKSTKRTLAKTKKSSLNADKKDENVEKPKKTRVSKNPKTKKAQPEILKDEEVNKTVSKSNVKRSEIDSSSGSLNDTSNKFKPKKVRKRTSKPSEESSPVVKSKVKKEPKRTGWWSSGS
jgi:ribonuclease E